MNLRSNIAEHKRLDKEIVEGEIDVEAKKWRQAELAFEACALDGGMTQADYAAKVGKSNQHISRLVRLWRQMEEIPPDRREFPHFTDAYERLTQGADGAGSARSRRAARQVPTEKQDQVDVMKKIVTTTSEEAIDEMLDDPVVKHRLKAKVDEDEAKRKARRQKSQTQTKADPAGKVVRDAIGKMDLYARALDMLAEEWVYALDEIPPELKAKLAKAADRLEAAAHRVAEATRGRRALRAVK